MAISAVAATKIQSATASASGAVSATAANTLVVGGAMYQSGSWSVTRTGDTYTTDTNGANVSDGTGIASAPNVVGGSVTCTITCSGGVGISGWALELSGLPTSAIRDATSPVVAAGTSTAPTSNSLTNVTADAIYVCSFGDDAGSTTITPGSGWTNVVGGTTMAEPNGAVAMVGGLEYQIVSTTAARTGVWAVGASALWACGIAVYKAAAAAAVTPPAGPWPRLMPLLAGPI